MKIFIGAIFLFTTLFLCLVILVDGSNTIIEKQMEVLVLQKEKERLSGRSVELEYLNALKTNEKELLRQLAKKPHLEFRS
jgi:hypothetical protein